MLLRFHPKAHSINELICFPKEFNTSFFKGSVKRTAGLLVIRVAKGDLSGLSRINTNFFEVCTIQLRFLQTPTCDDDDPKIKIAGRETFPVTNLKRLVAYIKSHYGVGQHYLIPTLTLYPKTLVP